MKRCPTRMELLGALLLLPVAQGGDWPHWRGPSFRGAGEGEGLPVSWGREEGVVWTAPLPGPSAATPVVWGERVFVSSFDSRKADLVALCLDRGTGRVLWTRVVAPGKGNAPDPRARREANTFAAPSPVTDGERAYFLFGTGDLAAFDFAGQELWRRNLVEEAGELEINYGYSSSPLVFEGRLYVQVLHRAKSYVLAFDPASGETLWRHLRASKARKESREAYTTPIPFRNGERWEILILGADCLTAHDPATGKESWRWRGLNPRRRGNHAAISSVVAGDDGTIVVCSALHGPMHGLRVRDRDVEEVWKLERPTPGITTPLYYRGRLYAVDGRNSRIVCLDPADGELLWKTDLDLPSTIFASPTAGDGKVYVLDTGGSVAVLAAGDELRVLGRNRLDSDPCRSSVVIDGGELLIRTAESLYCIGVAEPKKPR